MTGVVRLMRPTFLAIVVALAGCRADKKEVPVAPVAPPSPVAPASASAAPAPVRGPLGREAADLAPLRASIQKLAPLHVPVGAPKRGEWRAEHPESGETFEQYLNARPITPTEARGALVVQPLGDLGRENERVLATAARALEAFFGLPTRVVSGLSLRILPPNARRGSRGFGEQLLTSRILRELAPRLPDDAMAFIAFTANDLWPGEDWNYVFGEASLQDRVGVWSLARNGNPETKIALVRAIKTATHETGHMFGMHHCTAYKCTMAGVNSLEESDAAPTWLCPECLAKLSWATGALPEAHLERMRAFSASVGWKTEEAHYAKSLATLTAK